MLLCNWFNVRGNLGRGRAKSQNTGGGGLSALPGCCYLSFVPRSFFLLSVAAPAYGSPRLWEIDWSRTERGARAVTERLGSGLLVRRSPLTFKFAVEAVAGGCCLCHGQHRQTTVSWCLGMDWVVKQCDHAATPCRQSLSHCNFNRSVGTGSRAPLVSPVWASRWAY